MKFTYNKSLFFVHRDGKCGATAMVEVMREDNVPMTLVIDGGPNQLLTLMLTLYISSNRLYQILIIVPGGANFEILTKIRLAVFLTKWGRHLTHLVWALTTEGT